MSQPIKVKIMNEKEPIKIKATSNFPTVNVGGETDHSKLKNLDYAHSGHIGFASSDDIPIKISELENDKGYIDSNVSNLVNYELKGKTGTNLGVSIDNTTYVMTIDLKNTAGDVISTGSVDLPLESMVIGASYDDSTKEIVLTLQSGEEVRFSVADLVNGLVSQSDFDSAIEQIDGALDDKFDLPYYFEYAGDEDYEDTSEDTLQLFNAIREEMEANKRPSIIVRKGATGANAYQTYHFIIPQFGTLDTAYIMLKGAPIRKDGSTFNLVALNCERDPDSGQIIKVYEKKVDGSITIESSNIFYFDGDTNSTANKEMFAKIIGLVQNEELFDLIYKYDTTHIYYMTSYNNQISDFNQITFNFLNIYDGGGANVYGMFRKSYGYAYKVIYNTTNNYISKYSDRIEAYSSGSPLGTSNTNTYTPTGDYNPATKKYVDDAVSGASAAHYTWAKTTDDDAISMFQQVYNAYKGGEILNVDLKDGVKRYKLMSICQPNNMASEYWCQFRTVDWYTNNVDMIFLQTVNAVLNVSGDIVQSIDIKESVNEFGLIREYNGTKGALPVDNTKEFVPQSDYEPATKKYVDLTHYQRISGYTTNKTQVLKNINGTLTWVSEN